MASNLSRGLPFPKDLMSEIRGYANQSRSPTSSESTTPDTSFSYMGSSSGASSNSSSGSGASLPSTDNSTSFVENTLSSACSSLSTFAKSGRLHSICEVDHSSNNNSMNSSTLSSPDMDQQPILSCNTMHRALSASPS